jgi:RNA polymerase sigma factor (sigma-70 family)
MELEELIRDGHFLGEISASVRNIICANFPSTTSDEREDIDQDVKLKLWKLASSGKKVGNLRSYLWRVVYTTALDAIGKRLGGVPYENAAPEEDLRLLDRLDFASPERLMERKELRRMIGDAIESLPERRRLVIKLHLAGMDIEEAAGFLDWTENKVRHLLYRGLADLKKAFGEQPRAPAPAAVAAAEAASPEASSPPIRRRLVLNGHGK